MDLANTIFTPGLTALGAFLLSLLGLALWWLVRKRQKRVWLPTIRIIRLESRVLPRLVFRLPPVLAFLCFLTAAAVIVGFSLKPRTQIFTPYEPKQTRIHIFCDMSPSVSAQLTLTDYASRMETLFNTLKATGRVTISTSHSLAVSEPSSGAEVAALIQRLGFHRAGLSLGAALKLLLADLGEVDRLVVAADLDQHSWNGFNWKYLEGDTSVILYDLSQAGGAGDNVFINDAHYLAGGASTATTLMEWDVEIARRLATQPREGTLEVTYMGKSLGTAAWQIPAGKPRINVRIGWPTSLIVGAGKGEVPELLPDVPLVFRIDVAGGEGKGTTPLDNEFRAPLKGIKQEVLLVSAPTGERLLEDPAQQLQVALAIQGFKLKRADYLSQPGPNPDDYPFIIVNGGGVETQLDRFCPKSLETARLQAAELGGKRGARSALRAPLPKVWLAPQSLGADYRQLCRCYARLLLTTAAEAEADTEPAFCRHIESRSGYVGLLPSLGAKQIGGAMGDKAQALAWHATDKASGLEVLAFTVPLMPSAATGINHAAMPILIQQLLAWQGLITRRPGENADDQAGLSIAHKGVTAANLKAAAAAEAPGTPRPGAGDTPLVDASGEATPAANSALSANEVNWPRIDDIVGASWKPAVPLEPGQLARLRTSNVPLGESLMVAADTGQLPPRWSPQMDLGSKELPAKKDREDPLPWLRLAALIVVGVTGFEGSLGLAARLRQFVGKKPLTAAAKVLVLPLTLTSLLVPWQRAEAKVEFDLLGYQDAPASFQGLAREVSHRTSIEIASKPNTFGQLSGAALSEAWLWVRDLSKVTEEGGELRPDLALWVRRGGFLVIEAPATPAALSKLAAPFLRGEALAPSGDTAGVGWNPLPPDHELMRSFYLLDALPGCNGEVWRGFHYDGRLAILAVPFSLLASVKDQPTPSSCTAAGDRADQERLVRVFVNLVMVALATDYKKDQIHLPEILKRLR